MAVTTILMMDPEFLRRLQNRPGEIKKSRAEEQASALSQETQTRQAELAAQAQIIQSREFALAKASALAPELLKSLPGMATKLETLRAAIRGDSLKTIIIEPDNSGIWWESYRPDQLSPWKITGDEFAFLYIFPINRKSGNVLVPTSTHMVTYPGSPASRNGPGSPSKTYEKAIFNIRHADTSDHMGIMLRTHINRENANHLVFDTHFIHVSYIPQSKSDLEDVDFAPLTFGKNTIMRPKTDYMYGLPILPVHYPVMPEEAVTLPVAFEEGCAKLYDTYLQISGKV